MSNLFQAAFLITGSCLWVLAHIYLKNRLIGPSLRKKKKNGYKTGLMILLMMTAPAALVSDRYFSGQTWYFPVHYALYVYMGTFAVALPLVILRDLLYIAARLYNRLRPSRQPQSHAYKHDRRRFLAYVTNTAVLGITGMLTVKGLAGAKRMPVIKEVRVPLPGLPPAFEGYTIVQLSDLHIGPSIRGDYAGHVVEAANRLKPDLIALTGDFIDGFVPDLRSEIGVLSQLKCRDGVYFVTGNHEYYWDALSWCDEFTRMGFYVLNNSHRIIRRGASRILLAGAADYQAERFVREHASSPAKAIEGAPECPVKILLAHQPLSVTEARKSGFNLQLSGHTHGGQFIPWNMLLRFFYPYRPGLHDLGGIWLYVSSGTGYWGPPMRSGADSEITRLILTGSRIGD